MPNKKVFVSGCYDLLHSGHVEFFRQASQFGDLYVGIGSDETVLHYKNHKTLYPEQERLFMVKSILYIKDAFINAGSGVMAATSRSAASARSAGLNMWSFSVLLQRDLRHVLRLTSRMQPLRFRLVWIWQEPGLTSPMFLISLQAGLSPSALSRPSRYATAAAFRPAPAT